MDSGTLSAAHGVAYQPPVGRGFNADDLHTVELARLESELTLALPELVDEGMKLYINQLKQEAAMKAFNDKLSASLTPDNRKNTHAMLRIRAATAIAEAAKAEPKPTDPKAKVSK